jgi:hypothetical protein
LCFLHFYVSSLHIEKIEQLLQMNFYARRIKLATRNQIRQQHRHIRAVELEKSILGFRYLWAKLADTNLIFYNLYSVHIISFQKNVLQNSWW